MLNSNTPRTVREGLLSYLQLGPFDQIQLRSNAWGLVTRDKPVRSVFVEACRTNPVQFILPGDELAAHLELCWTHENEPVREAGVVILKGMLDNPRCAAKLRNVELLESIVRSIDLVSRSECSIVNHGSKRKILIVTVMSDLLRNVYESLEKSQACHKLAEYSTNAAYFVLPSTDDADNVYLPEFDQARYSACLPKICEALENAWSLSEAITRNDISKSKCMHSVLDSVMTIMNISDAQSDGAGPFRASGAVSQLDKRVVELAARVLSDFPFAVDEIVSKAICNELLSVNLVASRVLLRLSCERNGLCVADEAAIFLGKVLGKGPIPRDALDILQYMTAHGHSRLSEGLIRIYKPLLKGIASNKKISWEKRKSALMQLRPHCRYSTIIDLLSWDSDSNDDAGCRGELISLLCSCVPSKPTHESDPILDLLERSDTSAESIRTLIPLLHVIPLTDMNCLRLRNLLLSDHFVHAHEILAQLHSLVFKLDKTSISAAQDMIPLLMTLASGHTRSELDAMMDTALAGSAVIDDWHSLDPGLPRHMHVCMLLQTYFKELEFIMVPINWYLEWLIDYYFQRTECLMSVPPRMLLGYIILNGLASWRHEGQFAPTGSLPFGTSGHLYLASSGLQALMLRCNAHSSDTCVVFAQVTDWLA